MTRRLVLFAAGLIAGGTATITFATASTPRPVSGFTCVDVGPVTYNGAQVLGQYEACVPTPT